MTKPEPRPAKVDELEARLGDLLRVPPEVESRARQAFTARPPDGSELLELIDDSLVDSDRDPHVLPVLFVGEHARLELRIEQRDSGWYLSRVGGVRPRAVQFRTISVTTPLAVSDGDFSARVDDREPMMLLLETEQDGVPRRFHTNWFTT